MTVGQISYLLIAISVLMLAVFLSFFLLNLVKTLKIVNKEINSLGNQSSQLLDNVNYLVEDINVKTDKLDPTFELINNMSQKGLKVAEKFDSKNEEENNSNFNIKHLSSLLVNTLLSYGVFSTVVENLAGVFLKNKKNKNKTNK